MRKEKKIYYAIIFLMGLILITGCGRKTDAKSDISNGKDLSDEIIEINDGNSSDEIVSEEFESNEEKQIIEEDQAESKQEIVPEILNFVDVFGEEYQVEINPLIPKHPYDPSKYKREGQFLSYEDEQFTTRKGIDVSYHQGNIDWDKVADQGIDFVILRIGYRGYGKEGKIMEDALFSDYHKGATEAGLDVGVYFFAQAINESEAIEEAEAVLSWLEGKEITLPVVYDPESILDDEARTDDVTGEQFTKNTIAFCNKIKDAGYQPMIYSNMLWEAYELDLSQMPDIPVWYADYETIPQTPYNFVYLQYSNEGSIQGINGVCDLDIQFIKK